MTGLRVHLSARLRYIVSLRSLEQLERERRDAETQRANGYLNQYEWSRVMDQLDRRFIELLDAKHEAWLRLRRGKRDA